MNTDNQASASAFICVHLWLKPRLEVATASRAMWKGFLQVNVLHVPVKLYSAVRSQRVPFRMLHDQDLAPVSQRLWCPLEEKVVERDEVVKGYEVRKGQYILVEPEEMEKLKPAASR